MHVKVGWGILSQNLQGHWYKYMYPILSNIINIAYPNSLLV